MKDKLLILLVLFANITVLGQNDTLPLGKEKIPKKNIIQVGIINDYGYKIFKALANKQFNGIKPGVIYSRNLDFIHKNLWLKGAFFISKNRYSTGISEQTYSYSIFSVGMGYQLFKIYKGKIAFCPEIQYAYDKRVISNSFSNGSVNNEQKTRSAFVFNLDIQFGKDFFIGISRDLGYGKILKNIESFDENNNLTFKVNESYYSGVVMKSFVFSIGLKF